MHESAMRSIRCGRSVTARAGELTLRLGQLPCEPNGGCIGANTREVYYERHLTDAGKPIARAGLPVGVYACLEQTEGLRLREASAAAFPPGTKFASRGVGSRCVRVLRDMDAAFLDQMAAVMRKGTCPSAASRVQTYPLSRQRPFPLPPRADPQSFLGSLLDIVRFAPARA